MNITIYLNKEEYEELKKIQKQHKIKGISTTAKLIYKIGIKETTHK